MWGIDLSGTSQGTGGIGGLERRQINELLDAGLKNCVAQAKKNRSCSGCCFISLFLVTGKRDAYREFFYSSSRFYPKPCFQVQADKAAASSPEIEPYFGRWDYEHNWLYRFLRPDADRIIPIDNQLPQPQYREIYPGEIN